MTAALTELLTAPEHVGAEKLTESLVWTPAAALNQKSEMT